MQNLPVTAAPPAISTPSTVTSDSSSSASTVEPFGSVLARQRVNGGSSQDSRKQGGNQVSSSTGSDGSTITVSGSDATQAPATDAVGAVSGDVIAALLSVANAAGNFANTTQENSLPTASGEANTLSSDIRAKSFSVDLSTESAVTQDKPDLKASTPDGVVALPSDMLAMILPSTAVEVSSATDKSNSQVSGLDSSVDSTNDAMAMLESVMISKSGAGAGGKAAQSLIAGGGNKSQPDSSTDVALGEIQKDAKNNAASGLAEISLSVASNSAGTEKDNTFNAALEAISKDASKVSQLDSGASNNQIQQAVSGSADSVLQSGSVHMAVSQNEGAQAIQGAINTPVTQAAWGEEFNQKITWMANQREQTAELHLNPPNLGPLNVVLKVSGDQATALFTSPHAAVRDAVEQALPQLRDMLADNGITLGNAMVSDQSPRDQKTWQTGQQQKGNSGGIGNMDAVADMTDVSSISSFSNGRRHQGMVDTFA